MIRNQILQDKRTDSKGQKIAAALYLVTGHLPEHDPIRTQLRTLAVQLASGDSAVRQEIGGAISSLLEVGMIARIFSEGNVRILEAELKYFTDPLYQTDTAIANLFPPAEPDKGHYLMKRTESKEMSYMPKYVREQNNVSELRTDNNHHKEERREKILSYINEKKSVNVKDIASLFPSVSEKTIQRELGGLVAEGKISKRGDKRWSVYMANN